MQRRESEGGHPAASRGRRALALLLSLLLAVFAAALLVWILEASGVDLKRRLWLARIQLLGPEPVGIWRDDARLGWRHMPGATGRQRDVPDFDVAYHIDERGHRLTPGGPGPDAPGVLFLGGSFTFGHGVEDDEPYPALLQRAWPQVRVMNAATNAWGTAHALLALEEELAADDGIALVVYGFITHHVVRNHRSKPWLRQLHESRGRRSPFFALEKSQLVFRGLADPERDALPRGPEQLAREVRMTRRLLAEMARLCEVRGIPFVVVQLPEGGGGSVGLLEQVLGEQAVIDLDSELPYEELHFPHDLHLTPAGHAAVAEALRPRLEPLLPSS